MKIQLVKTKDKYLYKFDDYGNQLEDNAKDEFKELINRLEPTGFDLICDEVWK